MFPDTINGLWIEVIGNTIFVHAKDEEGTDKVNELNLALHVVKILRGKIEADPFRTTRYRCYVQTANGDLMSVNETKQAITFLQKTLTLC